MPQISAATTLASDTVDLVGVEPTTSSLQEKRSPIGTTDPRINQKSHAFYLGKCAIAHPKNSVQVKRAICVFSVTRGTPPMSYYTLFKGWLPLSPPIGFFALPVRHAHCI